MRPPRHADSHRPDHPGGVTHWPSWIAVILLLAACEKSETQDGSGDTADQPIRRCASHSDPPKKPAADRPKNSSGESLRQGDAAVLRELGAQITRLPQGVAREETVRLACSIDDPSAVPVAVDWLKHSTDEDLLRVAQQICARSTDPAIVQELLDFYDASDDDRMRDRLERTVALISSEQAVPVLNEILQDVGIPLSDGMVLASAKALARIGNSAAVDSLIGRLEKDPHEEDRAMLTDEIRTIRNPLAEERLRSIASGGYTPHVRAAVVGALYHHPSTETMNLLQSLVSDPDPTVQRAARETIVEIEARRAGE